MLDCSRKQKAAWVSCRTLDLILVQGPLWFVCSAGVRFPNSPVTPSSCNSSCPCIASEFGIVHAIPEFSLSLAVLVPLICPVAGCPERVWHRSPSLQVSFAIFVESGKVDSLSLPFWFTRSLIIFAIPNFRVYLGELCKLLGTSSLLQAWEKRY